MPGHDGLWLLEQVRLRYDATLRILCSGSPPEDLQDHLAAERVQLFLPKPVCSAALREALSDVLR
jgi:CheY-like chemotaxis protein